jgi:hypothetical protein
MLKMQFISIYFNSTLVLFSGKINSSIFAGGHLKRQIIFTTCKQRFFGFGSVLFFLYLFFTILSVFKLIQIIIIYLYNYLYR